MPATPLLRAGRLSLRPFAPAFLAPRYVAWLNDPEVVRYSEQRHRMHSLESCRAYVESFAGTPHHLWAIVANEPSLGHIGNLAATVDAPNAVADLAIVVGERAVWGRGYGAEAWQAACDWLLGDGGMRKVTAGTMAENKGMLAIMRKCGMVEEGRRRDQFLLEGHPVDAVEVALFREGRAS